MRSLIIIAITLIILGNGIPSCFTAVTDSSEKHQHVIGNNAYMNWTYQDGWPVHLGTSGATGIGISSPTFADLDKDGDLEIIAASRDSNIYVWHHNGSGVQGWPFSTNSYIESSPVVGDLDRDGYPEIVICSNDGYMYVLDHNGVLLDGWPILVDKSYPHQGGSHFQSSPALQDVDGDSYLDIIYNSNRFTKTYIFNYQGDIITGWPQNWDSGEFNADTPAIADLDFDDKVEIIVGVMNTYEDGTENYNKIYIWHANGTKMTGWPQILEDQYWCPLISPVIGDVDGDGNLDVVAVDYHNIYVLHSNGSIHDGWPFNRGFSLGGHSVALADFDDDVQLEIVATTGYNIFVLDDNGIPMDGFPVSFEGYAGGAAVADIDNDNENEIIVGCGHPMNSLYAWNSDGSLVEDFPLITVGNIKGSPIILDIDNDGDLEIGVGDSGTWDDHYFYMWDAIFDFNDQKIEWPMFQHDQYHTGFYNYDISYELQADAHGPYEGFVNQEIHFHGSASGGEPPYTYYWDFGNGDISEEKDPLYSYDEIGEYSISLNVVDQELNSSIDNTTVMIKEDMTPPKVKITRPENALYLMNHKIRQFIFRNPLLLGKIELVVYASDNDTIINHVEFYIDGHLQYTDTTDPYSWLWSDRTFSKHTVEVIAYDMRGNSASDTISVLKFF